MFVRKRSLRFSFTFLIIIFCLVIFSVKLIFIQFFRSSYLAQQAAKQHNYTVELDPLRGTIFDRRQRPLALNIPVYSLYANPRQMTQQEKQKAAAQIPSIISTIEQSFIRERLSRDKYFVWLARKLSLNEAEVIKNLKIHGLGFIKESKRYYPNGFLAAHLIGFAGMENEGLEGLELFYNSYLKGDKGWARILRDAKQRDLLIDTEFLPPRDGFNLVLTIDETIQFIAERALDKAFEKHHAKGATIIVMNPRSGEILALANRPTYDLRNFSKSAPETRVNRAIAYVYEPGSVFKIVAASAALEEEIFTEEDKIFCERGEYRIANHILHDHHPHGTLSFREVFEQSSNIGVTKIAQKMGPQKFYEYAKRFRFGMPTDIGLKGEVPGVLKSPSYWSKTSIGAIPIGHEVTVTPLQLVCAISAIANDGVYMKPFVVKYIKDNKGEIIKAFEPKIVDRVIMESTAQRVKAILTGVVERGTGRRAQVSGITIAGKTGTSQKVIGGVYSHEKFYASFIGFAPAEDPQIAAVVTFDEPHPSHFGGTVAAPVFQEMLVDTLKYLQASDYTR